MSLYSVLNVGATGMRAHQFGVSTAGQNASNAATEGYSRRRVHLEPIAPGSGGARATGASRVVDALLEKRFLGARSNQGAAEAKSELARTVDELFADVEGGIGERLDAFQAALGDVATYPGDLAPRHALLHVAGDVARAFNSASAVLSAARDEANSKIRDEVDQINGRLDEIAALGREISRTETPLGSEASDLRDRRDQLIREIGDAVPVSVLENDDGAVSLLLGGSMSLVSFDGTVTRLSAASDPTTGDMHVYRPAAGALEDVTASITSGRIAGLADVRDDLIAGTQTSLDQLAFDFASAYNTTHSGGVGLDGATGRNLWDPSAAVTGAAAALAVSGDVLGAPDRIAAAQDAASLPGDNRNANALLALADSDVALGATATISEAFGSLLGDVGTTVRSAYLEEESASTVADQVNAVREAVSGVSTDEEMISLMQFQRAYEASMQVVRTADELLTQVIALKR